MTQQLRCHDDVNQPYPRVRDALLANPGYVFRHATAAAATDAAALRVGIGALDVGVDVTLKVLQVAADTVAGTPMTKLTLAWSSAHAAALFPVMSTTLSVYPLPTGDTRLELDGTYQPPFGKPGEVIDAVLGHRVAEAAVKRFVCEVAGWLREELAVAPPAAEPDVPRERAPAELEC